MIRLRAVAASAILSMLVLAVAQDVAAQARPTTRQLADAASQGAAALDAVFPKGAAVDVRDGAGLTALMVVASRGDEGAVELLVARGADVDARNAQGWTPLLMAVMAGDADTVRSLVARSADPRSRNADGVDAVSLAQRSGREDLVQILDDAIASRSEIVVSNVPRLNLRKGPGQKERIESMAGQGEPLKVLERSEGWLRVQRSTGETGWVAKTLVTELRTTPATPPLPTAAGAPPATPVVPAVAAPTPAPVAEGPADASAVGDGVGAETVTDPEAAPEALEPSESMAEWRGTWECRAQEIGDALGQRVVVDFDGLLVLDVGAQGNLVGTLRFRSRSSLGEPLPFRKTDDVRATAGVEEEAGVLVLTFSDIVEESRGSRYGAGWWAQALSSDVDLSRGGVIELRAVNGRPLVFERMTGERAERR